MASEAIPTAREAAEQDVRARVARGDADGAAEVALRAFGGELFGFLLSLHDEAAADEVFSIASERIWRGLPAFGWECPLRAWLYVVVRNASHRHREGEHRRARRERPMTASAVSAVAAEVRSATLSLYRTENKSALAALRDALPPDDRMLLILRVDRELAWEELARVFREGEGVLDAEALKRESARLRKRFQLVKQRLLELGAARGLVRRS